MVDERGDERGKCVEKESKGDALGWERKVRLCSG